MYECRFTRQGAIVDQATVQHGQIFKRANWKQSANHPDSVSISNGAETIQRELKRGKTNARGFTPLTCSAKFEDGVTFVFHVCLGCKPSMPSYTWTISSSGTELASCVKCGTVFEERVSLTDSEPVCPSCKKQRGIA